MNLIHYGEGGRTYAGFRDIVDRLGAKYPLSKIRPSC